MLAVLAGIGILLLASGGAQRLVTRPRRAAGLLALVLLAAVFPSFVSLEQALPWILVGAALVLAPGDEAMRRVDPQPERAALALALLVLADLAVVAAGFVLHDPDVDGLLFEGVGVGLILVGVGAAIAAIPGLRGEVAARRH